MMQVESQEQLEMNGSYVFFEEFEEFGWCVCSFFLFNIMNRYRDRGVGPCQKIGTPSIIKHPHIGRLGFTSG